MDEGYGSDQDLEALRATGGHAFPDIDLAATDDAELLWEMTALETAKNAIDLLKEQEEFEHEAQREFRQTVKKIKATIKSSIQQSRETLTRKKTRRKTMKRKSLAGSGAGPGGLNLGLTNKKCGNCETYLEMIEKHENEIERL